VTDVALPVPGAVPGSGPPGAVALPDFEVVPRVGLIVAGVALVLLVAGVVSGTYWSLVLLHVAFGAGWTIVDLFMGFVIGPILGSLSIPARVELSRRLMPKMVVIMPTLVTATLVAGWQLGLKLGTVDSGHPMHGWVVASFIVVGVMAVIALGLLEPANIAVLIEMKKPQPDPMVIDRLMKRFVYSAGVIGAMQVAILVIMTKIRVG